MTDVRRRTVDERHADAAVLAALRERKGVATRADVVVASGLPEQVCEQSLTRLLDRYASAVRVRTGGVLEYRFDPDFRGRPERRRALAAVWRAATRTLRSLARAARAGFHALLGVQLLAYAVIVCLPISAVLGVLLVIVLAVIGIFSAIANGDGSILQLIADLFEHPMFALVLVAIAVVIGIGYVVKKNIDLLLAIVGKDPGGQGGLAGFIKQVNDFALGPPAGRTSGFADPTRRVALDDERIVLARVRRRDDKRLRSGDLVKWLGLGFEEADRQATRLCVEYGGEPGAAKDVEVVEFRFANLAPTAAAGAAESGKRGKKPRDHADEQTRFERGTTVPELTGNARREDVVIGVVALVNAGAGALALALFGGRHGWWHAAWWAGGVVPLVMSALIVGLAALRVPLWCWRAGRARRAITREAIVRGILEHVDKRGAAAFALEALPGGHDRTRAAAVELEGRFDLDESKDPPRTVWKFERLAAELGPA